MKKVFNLKPEKEKELLRAAKPIVTIFSAITRLKKEISEKERKAKNRRAVLEQIVKLKSELKKKEQELAKMDKEKVVAGQKALRFLLDYNRHLVEYIAKGYHYYLGKEKISQEELVAEGVSSLPKAIEKFDLNSKNQFCTYANFWIRQYFQSYIKKIQFIDQDSGEEKRNVVYYDSNYQNEDKESKSYSLLETIHDDEDAELAARETHHQEAIVQTNNLINSLKKREEIMLVRLLYKIKPNNLLDIYYLATTEEKKELLKAMKMSDKSNIELLQKYSCQEKKISNLTLVKSYLSYFTKKYKITEASKKIKKTESVTKQLKEESFKKLQKMAQERKLKFLIT